MKNMYSLNHILGKINSNDTSADWQKMYCLIRSFVAKSARGRRRARILDTVPSQLTICGLFDRLNIDVHDNGNMVPHYIAGQDYVREMSILRDCFDV